MRKIFLLLYLLTDLIVISEAEIIFTWTLWSSCDIDNIIDGDYTDWSEWDDCSQICLKQTHRRRTCHNPTPCNGGILCTVNRGVDELTKQCKVPPCLSYQIFSDKFLKIENAMSIYTSAQVDIYLLTKNKFTTATIIHTYFALYKITNITDNTEVQIGGNEISVKFKFNPGQYEIGYYRLYARIGYPANMTDWMEESMFVKIEQPPPHAFIKGGAGRTIGQGLAEFDARSVSYSLTKGPGDPSGLIFSWKCLNFVTNNIYNLLQFNIAPVSAFKDTGDYKKKWYETNFVPYIENNVAFIYASTLYTVIDSLQNSNSTCMNGSEFYVKAVLYKYPPTREQKDETTEA
ncbi:unnamed protein product [Mytilus edulis]|uniref:Uncharacterized protein n=1 Tax=Mytilus edulis TaxID=6550 RepID=A0A8S3UNX7_MYTED|nr:unnamed protein product [Mytilus edulis]